MTEIFSASRIAELLAGGEAPLLPTDEQRAVIEHPLRGTTLVVAGAGSGKTETMANRVVWLIANGIVPPDAVLGLTFTRKAAAELRERIATRLATFARNLADAASRGTVSAAEQARAAELTELLADGLDLPEVSTYNSFAAGVLQEFGLAASIPPGAAIIDDAAAWRIAREVVINSDDEALRHSELSISRLIETVINLDHAIADNLCTPEQVTRVVEEFSRVLLLPYNEKDPVGGPDGKNYAPVRDAVASVAETPLLARLAHDFSLEKQRRGVLEFSDQLALAIRTVERSTDAVVALRRRHRAVLLDEVQDTSVGQTRLLSRIFAGVPLMAVGDPHQSIYGWRGASAEGLKSFHRDFRATRAAVGAAAGAAAGAADGAADRAAASETATTLTLSTSWRNPAVVLDAANTIAAPLVAGAAIPVPQLAPRPGAAAGQIEWCYPETLAEEHARVAAWMHDAREAHRAEHGTLPTAAVIVRTRKHMPGFAAALTAAGVPNRIVGLGGLLSTPEITDIVSTLRCLWYADASGDLIRILTGPRFRIGVADIAGLRDAARWFAQRDISQQRLSDAERAADAILPDPDRSFTLIDALDQLAAMKDPNHAALRGLSETGFLRLRDAGRTLAQLRQGVGSDIVELIWAVVRALRLDIELEANESLGHDGSAVALSNIDAFLTLVEQHLAVDSHGTLASVLEWLERATLSDDAAEYVAAPVPGTVQLITVHGAKGLEWDLVAIPRLVESEFPGAPRDGTGWLRRGQLPDELRGDAAARPELNWRIAATQRELKERIADYSAELKERHADEERRLAYVAVTRAARRLLLTGSFWAGQVRPRTPSPYLLELQERGVISGLPLQSAHDSDPSDADELTLQWPLDPLGARSAAVLRAAAVVREQIEAGTPPADAELDETVRLLLAERARARHAGTELGELPDRITASTFHEFVEHSVQSQRDRVRPIPQRPYRRTRIGNLFHEWVERRSTTAHGTAVPLFGFDTWEAELDLADPDDDAWAVERELAPLQRNFEASRWAELQPIAVELEVTLPFAGRNLVCKLDAVYRFDEGDRTRYEVVDWKSGRAPRDAAERASRFLQLDLYRHAYAQWAGIDPADIDVTLFYVAEGTELRGETQRSFAELEELWCAAAATVSPDSVA